MTKNEKKNRSKNLNNPQETMVLDYNEWQKTMPQWLKDSQADLESGNVNDALKILDESQVQKKLKFL